MNISVIICTHNPREDYLHRTLASLKDQSLPNEKWELLVIDNANDKPLDLDLSWHTRARCVREDQMGLTPARLRGIREARGDLLVFVDDDNILARDYLEKATAILERHPFLGAYGAGVLRPEFETQPSVEVSGVLNLLALRTVTASSWSNNPREFATIPWGAGLCATRAVADHYLKLIEKLQTVAMLDRRGDALFCGGDDLFSWAAAELGCSFGIFPELTITHLIASRRVDPAYLLRLIHDHSLSHGILRYLLTGELPNASGALRHVRIFLHGIRRGRFSKQCHQETLRGETAARQFIRENRLVPLTSARN